MSEYIVVNNDKSTESTAIHPSPIVKPCSSPSDHIDNLNMVQKKPTGYVSNLKTPCGKPLFNCLLQPNPEPTKLEPKITFPLNAMFDPDNIPKDKEEMKKFFLEKFSHFDDDDHQHIKKLLTNRLT